MSSELNEKFKKKLEQLAEDNDEKVADVMVLFMALKSKILELEPHIPDMKANIRTYNGLTGYYSNKRFNKGQEFMVIPIGVYQDSKDTNEEEKERILKEFSNPQKRLEMIAGKNGDGTDGQIMVIKTSDAIVDNKSVFFTDVYKPVKSIKKMTQLSNGEWVVVDGDLWQPGDKPIPRNWQKTIQYVEDGEVYTNRGWSRPLTSNWKFSIFGVGYFSGNKQVKDDSNSKRVEKNIIDDGLISRITFYGDYANPHSPKFIGKKDLWFKPCKLKTTDTKYSNELFLQVTAKSDIEVSSKKLQVPKIIKKINNRVKNDANKVMEIVAKTNFDELPKDKAKKLHELEALYKKFTKVDYIPIIDLAGVNTYHLTHRALHKENGDIIKDEGGVWDSIDFNSFAISECALSGMYIKEGQAPKMILSDYSLSDNNSLFAKFSDAIDSELPPSSVYVSLTTSRGNRAYDPDTKEFVEDPENAVAIPKIKGIGIIMDYSKIDIESLVGDL